MALKHRARKKNTHRHPKERSLVCVCVCVRVRVCVRVWLIKDTALSPSDPLWCSAEVPRACWLTQRQMSHLEKIGFDVNVCAAVYQPRNVNQAKYTAQCRYKAHGSLAASVVHSLQKSLHVQVRYKSYQALCYKTVFTVGRKAKFTAVSH